MLKFGGKVGATCVGRTSIVMTPGGCTSCASCTSCTTCSCAW